MKQVLTTQGSSLLAVLIVGMVISSLAMVTFMSTSDSFEKVTLRKKGSSAFQIAEAGKEHALAELRAGTREPQPDSLIPFYNNKSLGNGFYTVQCSANVRAGTTDDVDSVWIFSQGVLNEQTASLTVLCSYIKNVTHISPSFSAAITAKSKVHVTGTIVIDGMDWDADGSAIVDTMGVPGIKTCGVVDQQGNSKIGGKGYLPQKDAMPPIIDTNVSPLGYPSTPEEALGLPPGALDEYKTTTLPPFPFYGIVYYVCAGTFNCPDFKGSTGIFICHNSSTTATIGNMNGTFRGIIIADQVNLLNADADIVGAIITLSDVESANNFGNGSASVKYSSEMINKIKNIDIKLGNPAVTVASWLQE